MVNFIRFLKKTKTEIKNDQSRLYHLLASKISIVLLSQNSHFIKIVHFNFVKRCIIDNTIIILKIYFLRDIF